MTKCKDCKRMGMCGIRAPIRCDENFSCSFAERADGLQVCCATCKHYEEAPPEDIVDGHFWNGCRNQHWSGDGEINTDVMLCPEWQPREEKE